MAAGQSSPLDVSAERLGLQLYAEVHRSSVERSLEGPTTRHWSGDLVLGRGPGLLFANLDTTRWQLLSPTQLRMELWRGLNASQRRRLAVVPQMLTDNAAIEASRRRPWRPQLPSDLLHVFARQIGGSRYQYLGATRPDSYGSGGSAFGRRLHIDCNLRTALPDELWQLLRSHRLAIDGLVIERGSNGELVELGNLGDVLEPLRRRQRAEASIRRRGLGELTYSKAGRSRVLTYSDPNGHPREARAGWEQGALDALWLFWADGFLAPWLEWL
jgi:hypothetical protein